MIAAEKKQLILSYGTDVLLYDHNEELLLETKALIGKGTKSSLQEVSIEYHRQAQFIPEIEVPNGSIMYNKVTGEKSIAVANMTEIHLNEKLATIVRLLETNATVTITSEGETADEYGNVSYSAITKVDDKPVYITWISAELQQFKPGLFESAEYVMYISSMDIKPLDKVIVNVGGIEQRMKVETVDYLSFVGVVLVGLCTETRA